MQEKPGGHIGVGSTVAGYRLVDVLGVGGSGTVYRAERDGVSVALKLLNAEHAKDDGERARFAREADVVRTLAHPHVVSLIDYGFAGQLPYLVFPLLEGRTLEKRIAAEGKVGWGLAGRFSEEGLSALEVAHAMGIAHRDIKPANIFCCQSASGESIRLLDFGTAKIVGKRNDSGSLVTRAGMLIGTPRYMAPEQARGEELTPAADVYAFGLVMAEMLLGRPLVTGAADLDIYVAQGSDRPHELPEDIRYSPFATIIERAIAKKLDVRYRLASQMLADVRAILARFGRGAATPLPEADLEVTRFLGIAEPVAVPESAEKLRKVFNAMANRAAAVAAPALIDEPTPLMAPPPAPESPVRAPAKTTPESPVEAPPASEPAAVAPDARVPEELPLTTAGQPSSAAPRLIMIALLTLAVLGAVTIYIMRKRSAARDAESFASADIRSASTVRIEHPREVSSNPAMVPPPATAPPGAFSAGPFDRAPLARFLDDKDAKQTPELYELALQQMASCELGASGKPSCKELDDYESTIKRSMKKKGYAKRREIAVKYLESASPTVRLLSARMLASSDANDDLDALLRAAKVEPVAPVLAEMITSMTHDRPDFVELEKGALASNTSPIVRAAACSSLGVNSVSAPLDALVLAAKSDADATVRTQCFAALTTLWVRTKTGDPRKDAYQATLAILEAKPRHRAHLPEGLGRLREAKTVIPDDDATGIEWAKKTKAFYESKRLADDLEDLALDPQAPLELRRAALKALGSIDKKERASSVRKKVASLTDPDSQELVADPKSSDTKKPG